MILGIDAANIRADGGLVHLVEILGAAQPAESGFTKVVVWGGRSTLNQVNDRPWLVKSHQIQLDQRLPVRIWWQHFKLPKLARLAACDLLFVPGGSCWTNFRPMVAFSQNVLPFERKELSRFGWSWMTLKLKLLRWVQSRTFRRADGLIVLTHHAGKVVAQAVGGKPGKVAIVPHGVHGRFARQPREQLPIETYSMARPFQVLYVSKVYPYKHQRQVVEAVKRLRVGGLPVKLDLVGSAYPPALRQLEQTLNRLDPTRSYMRYLGEIPHEELTSKYFSADLFVFASSCEAFAMIITEGMSAGLPMACSDYGAIREVVGDGALYFNPEDSDDIARVLRTFIESTKLRTEKAEVAFGLAQMYSWKRCARDTFNFLASICQDTV